MSRKANSDGGPGDWAEELRTLGERMAFARRRLRMTKRALADLSGVDYTTIGRIESGTRLATLSALISIARALGVPVGWLIAGEGALPEAAEPPPGVTDQRRRSPS